MRVGTPIFSKNVASEVLFRRIGLTKSDRRLLSSGDLLRVLSARSFVFQCQGCSLFLLKNTISALEWRSATVRDALPSPKWLLILSVAVLLTTRCHHTYGINSCGVPEGLCSGCYLKYD